MARLTDDDHKPLLNKVMDGVYPPGSTFKPVVALAAVEAGLATPDYRVTCNGRLTLGNHTFHCWKKGGHGTLDLEGGIKNSCDVFFYETARRLGIDKIQEVALQAGPGRAHRHRAAGREVRLHSQPRLEAEDATASPGSRATRSAAASARAMSPPRRCSWLLQVARIASRQGGQPAPGAYGGQRRASTAPEAAAAGFLARRLGAGARGHEPGGQ